MKVQAYATHVIQPNESILDIVDVYFTDIQECDIIVITSKIISICENRIVPKEGICKFDLIKQEAQAYLDCDQTNPQGVCLTIKNGFLIPTAGIDESNCLDGYILYPEDIQKTATKIWQHVRETRKVREVGILVTDSRTSPLRRGVTGIGIGWCGFMPLYNYIGKPDIFDKPLRVTMTNILDALAAASVFVMGEGNEQTPLARIQDAPKIVFVDHPPTKQDIDSVTIALEEDLYAPLLTSVPWKMRFTKCNLSD